MIDTIVQWRGLQPTASGVWAVGDCATDPQLGRVGLNAKEAKAAGIAYRISRLPMAMVLRARAIFETRGFMKALIDAHSDRIMGFTALSTEAGELIAVVQTAMLTRAPYTVFRDAILTHPTIAEGLGVLFQAEPQPASATPQASLAS
jgi:pyruvate/2-oxoglutarate dehydrogenase complex dihydrolipoamide dehydrogenase (E3) component